MRFHSGPSTVLLGLGGLVVMVLIHHPPGGATARPVRAQPAPAPPVLDAKASIVPCIEDFTPDLNSRIRFLRRGDKNSGELLRKLREPEVHNALGWGTGEGPASRRPGDWISSINYVIYKTPKDAKSQWLTEDLSETHVIARPGSFSGAKIGDDCASRAGRTGGLTLKFVRHNVSVSLGGYAFERMERMEKTGQNVTVFVGPEEREAFSPVIKEALEAAASAIVSRIDRVVKAKGSVDMSNLPPLTPLQQETGPQPRPEPRTPRPPRAKLRTPPHVPIDAKSVITPSVEDLPASLRWTQFYPRQRKTSHLAALPNDVHVVDAIGGGVGLGPAVGLGEIGWVSNIRYIIYKTPEAALANWTGEDPTLDETCTPGSFGGETIGDASEKVADVDRGVFVLGFVRNRVSVHITAVVAGGGKGTQKLLPDLQKVLEITAKVIVSRIDGVIPAKGYVDMNNLPKVLQEPVPFATMRKPTRPR